MNQNKIPGYGIEFNEKYKVLSKYISPIKTVSNNPYLKNGDLICFASLKNENNKSKFIKNGDLVLFKNHNTDYTADWFAYKAVKINELEFQFIPISEYINSAPFIVKISALDKSELIGKILFSFNPLTNVSDLSMFEFAEK